MTEFLTTAKTTAAIENIIRQADEWVLLISPYLKFDENFKRRIENKSGSANFTIIYGKKKLQSKEDSWLRTQEWIETRFCKTLHAKCYLNEKEAVLTSMNLHKFSQENNNEMGIRASRENDRELYEEILEEAKDIERISELVAHGKKSKVIKEASATYSVVKPSAKEIQVQAISPSAGYCLRCKRELKASPSRPYCDPHFKTWNKFKNDKFEEQHCHLCGKRWKTSRAKPVCKPCWDKHTKFVETALSSLK